jgi:hypothetical protein
MNIIKSFLFFGSIVLLTSSCAFTKSTRYQSNALTGGYTETRLGEDMFDVRFAGNGWTNPEKTNDFCLLRCAELSEQNNYPFFTIIENKEGTVGQTDGAHTNFIYKPTNHNTIKLFKQKPDSYPMVYEAKYIISSIRLKYNIN